MTRGSNILLAAGALTVALRILMCLAIDHVPYGDPIANLQLARAILDGNGLVVDLGIYGADVMAMYPPAYPLLLAATGAVLGFSVWAISFLNTAIDFAVAGLIIRLGRLTEQPAAYLAAAAYLLWPSLILSAPIAQKEGLLTLLVMVIIVQFADLRLGWKWASIVGLASGLVALTQPSMTFLPACIGLLLIRQTGFWPMVRMGLIAGAVAALVLLPWWVRNWLLFQQFIPLTTSSGHSLMVVLNNGHEPLPPGVLDMSEPARSDHMGALARQRIAADPLHYLKQVTSNIAVTWGKGSFAHERITHYAPFLILPWAIINAAQLAFTAWSSWLFPNRKLLLILAGCLVWMGAFAIWFEFSERHRQFLLPLLWLLAAPTMAVLAGLRPKRAPAPRTVGLTEPA